LLKNNLKKMAKKIIVAADQKDGVITKLLLSDGTEITKQNLIKDRYINDYYVNDIKVKFVPGNNPEYIRTDANSTTKDNLGEMLSIREYKNKK
jgi:hypothetical protein